MPPSTVIERGGVRIGIIGVMTETLKTLVTPEALADFRTTPAIEGVRQAAAALRGKTDIIVLLAHFTPEEEQVVLREAVDVNVVIGAHLHTALPQPTNVEGRLLVRLNSNATEIGRLELQVDTEAKKVVKYDWRRIAVGMNTIKPRRRDAAGGGRLGRQGEPVDGHPDWRIQARGAAAPSSSRGASAC